MHVVQRDSPAPDAGGADETPVRHRRAECVDDMIGIGYFPDEVGLENARGEPLPRNGPT